VPQADGERERPNQPDRQRNPRRAAWTAVGHTALLLMVDHILPSVRSTIAMTSGRVDVSVSARQKGFMCRGARLQTRSSGARPARHAKTNAEDAAPYGREEMLEAGLTRRILPLYGQHQPALTLARIVRRDAARRRARQRLRPPSAAGSRDARGRHALGGWKCCARSRRIIDRCSTPQVMSRV